MKISIVSYISLFAGLIIGMAAQKSRMCFIGGWRDFFLIRDSYLLKGFISFLITAAVLFFAFDAADFYLKNYPWFKPRGFVSLVNMNAGIDGVWEDYVAKGVDVCELSNMPNIVVGVDTSVKGLIIGGHKIPYELIFFIVSAFIIGLFSTLANGCPMRQHVMAASGNLSALCFLLGFYAAVIIFDKYLASYFNSLIL